MHRSGFRTIATTAFLASTALAVPLHAQGLLPERTDVAGGRTQPGYDAEGVRLGSMQALPALGVRIGHDSNLYGEDTNATADQFAIFEPSLQLRTDWGIDGVALSASGGLTRYVNTPTQNTNEYAVRAGGRLNLGEANVSLGMSATRDAERRGENGTPLSRIEPSFANVFAQTVGVGRDISAFGLRVTVSHRDVRYPDVAGATQSFRDSEEWEVSTAATYAPSDAAAIGLSGSYARARAQEDAGRGNDTSSVRARAAVDTGMLRLEGQVAYLHRAFTNPDLRDFSGLIYNGTVNWHPTSLLTVSLGASRSLENSGSPRVGVIVGRTLRLGADYELLRNLVVRASYLQRRQQFREVGGFARGTSAQLDADFRFNRNVAIGAYGRRDCKNSAVIDTVRHFCTTLGGISLSFRR